MDATDEPHNDDSTVAQRARARDHINEIARKAKQALTDAGIDIPVFFIVPTSGAILVFGTVIDVSEIQWSRASGVIACGWPESHAMPRGRVCEH